MLTVSVRAQTLVPIDIDHWDIEAKAYVIEKFKGQDAIYLQEGSLTLKEKGFLNGIIEYDIFLKDERGFPGIYFRTQDSGDAEHFYVRPHQSGNPDSNQAIPLRNNMAAWQLYFGERYSFPYEYNFDDWTHIKIVVKDDKAQIFLDHSENPNLSWDLFHTPKEGKVVITGGASSGLHIANIKISHETPELKDFKPLERKPIEGAISSWEISDMFKEDLLEDPNQLESVIKARKWQGSIRLEEGVAADISSMHNRFDGSGNNTVLAKVTIESNKNQLKYFEFGYSDRVVAILNGKPIYRGNNNFRSRDYRYLGTIGLFDGIYLGLKKGENELIMAVSENFGGWLITGRFKDSKGVTVK